ncbi:hypothetical protein FIU93_22670 [Labrenzia sp. THAF35]|uniref:DUF3168 domain-containing protein n=1 Tax=Labrenzia sp. THAF35 TaxID=2587854 RepID=UPI0012690B9B|nr:DUF3168 domain-containing protein [Labrenzia sp. THAF35]QFT69607.1 hypothetical protein FIU93_22670 [Labrenzia sp. THAF35]
MAESSEYELELAVMARVKADASFAGYCANRFFDRVPDNFSTFPYVAFGPSDNTPDDADCVYADEITFQIDVYSRGSGEAYGSAQVKKIASIIKKLLHDAEFSLTDNALANIQHRITRFRRESDGATNRAIMTFIATVELGD